MKKMPTHVRIHTTASRIEMVKNLINQNISRNFSCCAYLSACRPCWIHFDVQYGKMEIWKYGSS